MATRTQQQRRAATRRALLDAAVETVVELGHARTTTTEVVRRAGLSQGALFAHFPTKAELLATAVEELYPSLVAEYVGAIAAEVQASPVPDAALGQRIMRRLLDAMLRPETQAALELLAAARTDEDLAARIAPVEAEHRRTLREHAEQLFPHVTDVARLHRGVDLALDVAIGMAQTIGVADADRTEGELAFAGEVLALALTPQTQPPTPA